jgi:hypothetical protein
MAKPKQEQQGQQGSTLKRGAVATGLGLAGAVVGARTGHKLLRKGVPLERGESNIGKVLYTESNKISPLAVVGGADRVVRKYARQPGLKGAVARGAQKVDNFLSITQRHYGTGVGGGRVVDKTRTKPFRVVSEGEFGAGSPVMVDRSSIGRVAGDADIQAINGRFEKVEQGASKKSFGHLGTNCEHQARFLAGQGSVSHQVRATAAGAALGAVAGVAGGIAVTRPKPKTVQRKMLEAVRALPVVELAMKPKIMIGHANKGADRLSQHTKTMPNGDVIDVGALVHRFKGVTPSEVPIHMIQGASRSSRSGFSPKRYEKAQTKHPVLIDKDNFLIDGRHRYLKLKDQGRQKVKVIRVSDAELMQHRIKNVEDAVNIHQLARKTVKLALL